MPPWRLVLDDSPLSLLVFPSAASSWLTPYFSAGDSPLPPRSDLGMVDLHRHIPTLDGCRPSPATAPCLDLVSIKLRQPRPFSCRPKIGPHRSRGRCATQTVGTACRMNLLAILLFGMRIATTNCDDSTRFIGRLSRSRHIAPGGSGAVGLSRPRLIGILGS
jgi:hypothetical protein